MKMSGENAAAFLAWTGCWCLCAALYKLIGDPGSCDLWVPWFMAISGVLYAIPYLIIIALASKRLQPNLLLCCSAGSLSSLSGYMLLTLLLSGGTTCDLNRETTLLFVAPGLPASVACYLLAHRWRTPVSSPEGREFGELNTKRPEPHQ